MKKLVLFLVSLCCIVGVSAQERYEVISKSSLNIRSTASTNGTILGNLQSGSTVEVYEIYKDWAKIKYNDRFAYVNSRYLKKCQVKDSNTTSQNYEKKSDNNSFLSKFDLEQYQTGDIKWMAFVIFGLSIVLVVIRKILRDDEEPLSDNLYIVNMTVFALTCILEFVYFLKMGNDMIWFCFPDNVGWIGAIVGFVALGWVAYNQFMCFMNTLQDLKYNAGDFDMRIGIYSWPIAVIAGIIANIVGWEDGNMWILIILGVCQLIQIGIIIAGVTPYSGFFYSLLVIVIYLMGAISTLLILVQFLVLLIVVIIAGLIIMGVLNGASSSSSSSSSSSDNNSGWKEGSLNDPNSMGPIHGRFSSDGTFYEYGGGIYDEQLDGSYKKRE